MEESSSGSRRRKDSRSSHCQEEGSSNSAGSSRLSSSQRRSSGGRSRPSSPCRGCSGSSADDRRSSTSINLMTVQETRENAPDASGHSSPTPKHRFSRHIPPEDDGARAFRRLHSLGNSDGSAAAPSWRQQREQQPRQQGETPQEAQAEEPKPVWAAREPRLQSLKEAEEEKEQQQSEPGQQHVQSEPSCRWGRLHIASSEYEGDTSWISASLFSCRTGNSTGSCSARNLWQSACVTTAAAAQRRRWGGSLELLPPSPLAAGAAAPSRRDRTERAAGRAAAEIADRSALAGRRTFSPLCRRPFSGKARDAPESGSVPRPFGEVPAAATAAPHVPEEAPAEGAAAAASETPATPPALRGERPHPLMPRYRCCAAARAAGAAAAAAAASQRPRCEGCGSSCCVDRAAAATAHLEQRQETPQRRGTRDGAGACGRAASAAAASAGAAAAAPRRAAEVWNDWHVPCCWRSPLLQQQQGDGDDCPHEEEEAARARRSKKACFFLRASGRYNIRHAWRFTHSYIDFLVNDRFHVLLSLRWPHLVFLVLCVVVAWSAVLAMCLAVATGGDYARCLGAANSPADFYYFIVETLFSVGYGSPRYPSCRESSIFVTPTVVSGVLLNSLVLGVVFQKFSAASKRKWALAFSSCLTGRFIPASATGRGEEVWRRGAAGLPSTATGCSSSNCWCSNTSSVVWSPRESQPRSRQQYWEPACTLYQAKGLQQQQRVLQQRQRDGRQQQERGQDRQQQEQQWQQHHSEQQRVRQEEKWHGDSGSDSAGQTTAPVWYTSSSRGSTSGSKAEKNGNICSSKAGSTRNTSSSVDGAGGAGSTRKIETTAEEDSCSFSLLHRRSPAAAALLPSAVAASDAGQLQQPLLQFAAAAETTSPYRCVHRAEKEAAATAAAAANAAPGRAAAAAAAHTGAGTADQDPPAAGLDQEAEARPRRGEEEGLDGGATAAGGGAALSAAAAAAGAAAGAGPCQCHAAAGDARLPGELLLHSSCRRNARDTEELPRRAVRISFRVINVTHHAFFNPKLSLFLLTHSEAGLVVRQFPTYTTDTPLEFLELPVTVTIDSRDWGSPLAEVDEEELRYNGGAYELLTLLSFTDNHTSRPVEIRKSWSLNSTRWGEVFLPIVSPLPAPASLANVVVGDSFLGGAYEVEVDALSSTEADESAMC